MTKKKDRLAKARKELLGKIANEITPSAREARNELFLAKELMQRIRKKTPKSCNVALVGSVAKKTFLRENRDIDIFLLFPKSVEKSSFEKIVTGITESVFPNHGYELRYAEHPYVTLHYEGRRIDIVPAYSIKRASDMLSAVDRSVLHTAYVIKKLKNREAVEVLLLKKFLRSLGIYGAEIRVAGFSGYLCELLILKYGTFEKLLARGAEWKGGEFIDIEKYYSKNEIEEAKKRFSAPLVVVDAVDKNRNVSAALSLENMKKFSRIAKTFMNSPQKKYFSPPKTFDDTLAAMKKKSGSAVVVSMPSPKAVEEVLWGQLKRLEKQLVIFLHSKDFEVLEAIAENNRARSFIALRLKNAVLPQKKLILGPGIKLRKNVVDFKKAHPHGQFRMIRGRICTLAKRKLITVKGAIEKFFTSSGIPSHFEPARKAFRIEKLK